MIQNADDNSYAADTTPTLSLVLQPHALTVFNNETGFTAAQARRLPSSAFAAAAATFAASHHHPHHLPPLYHSTS